MGVDGVKLLGYRCGGVGGQLVGVSSLAQLARLRGHVGDGGSYLFGAE